MSCSSPETNKTILFFYIFLLGYRAEAKGSLSQPQPEQEHWPQDAPPAGDWLHLGDSRVFRRIDLGAGDFLVPVAQAEDFEEHVNFQLVFIEPGLIQVDTRVVEQGKAD